MDKVTALFILGIVVLICIIFGIGYVFGIVFLIRLVFGIGYGLLTVIFAVLLGILIYAKSKYSIISAVAFLLSAYATYQCYVWNQPIHVALITAGYIIAALVGIWWISEPDLNLIERIRSAESLERAGRFKAAARKYEKKNDYVKAAECYIKSNLLESAAWCFERAEKYDDAAKIYEKLAGEKEDSYYWKEAYEMYKKANDKRNAARCLEEYAKEEPWYWEDVAKLYEEIGDTDKSKEAWKKSLDYYVNEAKEEGVFWEDVSKIYEKLGETEKSKEAMLKFIEYAKKEAEKDESWWKHVAESYEKLGMKSEAEEAWGRYREYRNRLKSKT